MIFLAQSEDSSILGSLFFETLGPYYYSQNVRHLCRDLYRTGRSKIGTGILFKLGNPHEDHASCRTLRNAHLVPPTSRRPSMNALIL